MLRNRRSCRHWSLGALAAVTLGLAVPPTWALGPGAPPNVTSAQVWVSTFSTNAHISTVEGVPQLYTSMDVEIPGGNVPLNVASVRVTLPDGITHST